MYESRHVDTSSVQDQYRLLCCGEYLDTSPVCTGECITDIMRRFYGTRAIVFGTINIVRLSRQRLVRRSEFSDQDAHRGSFCSPPTTPWVSSYTRLLRVSLVSVIPLAGSRLALPRRGLLGCSTLGVRGHTLVAHLAPAGASSPRTSTGNPVHCSRGTLVPVPVDRPTLTRVSIGGHVL